MRRHPPNGGHPVRIATSTPGPCFAAAERHDLVFHFHTSAGGNSDINELKQRILYRNYEELYGDPSR